MQNNIPILTLPQVTTAAVLAQTFSDYAGATSGNGGRGLGVYRSPSDFVGQPVPVDVVGTAQVLSGAAFAQGAQLQSDANGNAITAAGGAVRAVAAFAAATAAGQVIEVLLVSGN